MHTVSPPHPWALNQGSKTVQVFIEKNPYVSGPALHTHVIQGSPVKEVIKEVAGRMQALFLSRGQETGELRREEGTLWSLLLHLVKGSL